LLQNEVPEVESNTRSEYAGVLETVFQTLYGLGPVRTFWRHKELIIGHGPGQIFCPLWQTREHQSTKLHSQVCYTYIHSSLGT